MNRDHKGLLGVLDAAGVLADPRLRAAFTQVDRGLFIPEQIWVTEDDGTDRMVSRVEDESRWLAETYVDEPVVTQMTDGDYTSSASMPSIVANMITHLDVANGMRVLEAGTGTGYNAALLSVLAGDANVTTVETDPDVIERARQSLRRAGFAPRVVSGDASLGYPVGAPYDRVIGTYTVQTIPYPWVEQCSHGGVIVTPWGNAFDNSALLRLRVDDDGTASGRFVDSVDFMWDRGQVPPFAYIRDVALDEHDPDVSTTKLDPGLIIGDAHALFAIGLRIPDCRESTVFAPDDSGRFATWVLALDRASWACVSFEPDEDEWEVEQYGPRRLWDEVENAYARWEKAGRPERERYGITVTPTGQHIWLDQPLTP